MVTNNRFTANAKELASKVGVELWDGNKIKAMSETAKPKQIEKNKSNKKINIKNDNLKLICYIGMDFFFLIGIIAYIDLAEYIAVIIFLIAFIISLYFTIKFNKKIYKKTIIKPQKRYKINNIVKYNKSKINTDTTDNEAVEYVLNRTFPEMADNPIKESIENNIKLKNKPKEYLNYSWQITISFEKSSSENYDNVLFMAESAPEYSSKNINGNTTHYATYSGHSYEFLVAMQLLESTRNWQKSKVFINNELINDIGYNILNCYNEKCRSSNSHYCFWESYINKNIFGCRNLKTSDLYTGFADCFVRRNGVRYLDKSKVISSIYSDYSYLKYCPVFDLDNAIIIANSLPDKLTWDKYGYMLNQLK